MAWTTPGTAVAGAVLEASFWNSNVRDNLNAVGRGLIAFASNNTQTTFVTTVADIASLSVTWTAEATKNYLVLMSIAGTIKQTNVGNVQYLITDSGNVVKERFFQTLAVDQSLGRALAFEFIRNASAGSTTRKARQVSSTAGGVFNRADVSDSLGTFLAVIDLGNTSV